MDNLKEMDKVPDIYNQPRLNHDKRENLNKLITSKEIELVLKNPTNKNPGLGSFTQLHW